MNGSAVIADRPTEFVAPIAVLCPGQGSQKPGMLSPWLALPGVEKQLSEWSQLAGMDLMRLGTAADASEIVDTAVAQPLVVAMSLIALQELQAVGTLTSDTIIAGHSVGELAAAVGAGVISSSDAIALAAVRGRVMASACGLAKTGMSAVLGGELSQVLVKLDELGLMPANYNGAGQVVVAGRIDALCALSADPPPGTKVVALRVAGAFHTSFMASAQERFTYEIRNIHANNPIRPLLSNADGKFVTSGDDALARIAAQITRPVRWDLCTETLASSAVSAVVELPPAGALTGIARRELPDVARRPLRTPVDLLSADLTGAGA
ncbi:acyltransferase domain-containing protein [Nocardia sp. ET3-3]|uniref:[acyl-carrier-protein] S-malonyltransferase n=1 Tax=Nocardia terrae TaxID=2675851 RepID=A0A7K1V3V0_9NOCA|nr:ACP S-malonyltransferase [Nocardia terrae]MVU81303.1 acyltransferase domain-containing protein [Nocardia terrae]